MSGTVQKSLTISGLACVILIALALVSNLIEDRQQYRDEAVKAIEASFAGPQTLTGPVLVRPYTQTTVTNDANEKGIKTPTVHRQELVATSFPQQYAVEGSLDPSQRRHGLYDVEVFELHGKLDGYFDVVDPSTEGTVVWGEPYLALSVTDVRGLSRTPRVQVNHVDEPMLQGAPAATGWQPNLRVPLRGATSLHGRLPFAFTLDLQGTETLSIAPLGDFNRVALRSSWHAPLFAGQFLPGDRQVQPGGFSAVWQVSSLASITQTQLLDSKKDPDLISVSLRTLLDPYALSERAVKYGVLFVVLTFAGFFLYEVHQHLSIHPVQYLLIGSGLAIFFLLLVSFSERIPFSLAYLIAAAACIGLLTFYLSFVLRSVIRGTVFGTMLSFLYAAIYGLLVSEDNALLLGSLLLFALLAAAMVLSGRMDAAYGAQADMPPPPFPA